MHVTPPPRDYFWHSLGHYLGLDTHDTHLVGHDRPLAPGAVITVEPGGCWGGGEGGTIGRVWGGRSGREGVCGGVLGTCPCAVHVMPRH